MSIKMKHELAFYALMALALLIGNSAHADVLHVQNETTGEVQQWYGAHQTLTTAGADGEVVFQGEPQTAAHWDIQPRQHGSWLISVHDADGWHTRTLQCYGTTESEVNSDETWIALSCVQTQHPVARAR